MTEYILYDGKWTLLLGIVDHEPGEHTDSPIRNDLPAREWVTDYGSRWSGLHDDGTPFNRVLIATRFDGSNAR